MDREVILGDLKFKVRELPPDWKGAKRAPASEGVIRVWLPGVDGENPIMDLFFYPDGSIKGRGVRHFGIVGSKVLSIYKSNS